MDLHRLGSPSTKREAVSTMSKGASISLLNVRFLSRIYHCQAVKNVIYVVCVYTRITFLQDFALDIGGSKCYSRCRYLVL